MAVGRLRVDGFTRSELGADGLTELSRNLWSGACQSCGEPIGVDSPALVVSDEGHQVIASLHHPRCEQPQWSTLRVRSTRQRTMQTTSARLIMVPFGDPATAELWPVLVVNPSLEEVALTCGPDGRYKAMTVDRYRTFGLKPPPFQPTVNSTGLVTSWLSDERLVVRCGDRVWVCPLDPADRRIADRIRRCRGVVLGVSTAVEPTMFENPEPLKRVLRSGEIGLTLAELDPSEPPAGVTAHGVIADPHSVDEVDWLPEFVPFGGVTYDSATGRFEIGVGMDGPAYWQLHTPGVRVENGLIAGPRGIGKTMNLRVIAVEAIASTVFHCIVADPLDGGLADTFASAAEVTSSGTATANLLEAWADEVDRRNSLPSFRIEPASDVTQGRPGIVFLVDDAGAVLADIRVARAAERIAKAGPGVGIGLVLVVGSVRQVADSGADGLLAELTRVNVLLMSQEEVALLGELRKATGGS
ncbi:hypothetical protein [Tenggerimyces flavus]|uniref:FtsK domain-containing protein n=1 Tax=Tenggerimyces flavus TaxID=1708749 RepID=A0ABV7YH99_9ACTN|nr:hypothetical protein [Tenggerimyces flavus]MBM7790051.1 hypothetical protein [Tenggerimyces flavus]